MLAWGRTCSVPLAAVRVTHSAVADSSEEPTLAEGTVIAARAACRFTASPQGNAVGRRRRAFLYTNFVLSGRKKRERSSSYDSWHTSRLIAAAVLIGGHCIFIIVFLLLRLINVHFNFTFVKHKLHLGGAATCWLIATGEVEASPKLLALATQQAWCCPEF